MPAGAPQAPEACLPRSLVLTQEDRAIVVSRLARGVLKFQDDMISSSGSPAGLLCQLVCVPWTTWSGGRLAAGIPQLQVVGGEAAAESPAIHLALHLQLAPEEYDAGDAALQLVVEDCLSREGVMVALARYSKLERRRPPPSLRVAVTADHIAADLRKAVAALKASCKRVLG